MKKALLVLILTIEVLGFDTKTASKIFTKIFSAIFSQEMIKVYTEDKEYQKVIQTTQKLRLSTEISLANILLINKKENLPKKEGYTIFTTNLSVFRNNKDAIGAFYWEHNRPKIVFLEQRLKHKDITLSKPFQQYIIKELP